VGSLAVARTAVNHARNFTFPIGETPLRAARVDDTRAGGGRRPVGVGNDYCRLSLSTTCWPYEMRAEALAFLRAGEDKLMWFAPDNANPWRSYLGWLVGQATLQQAGVNKLTLAGVVLEEAV